MIKEEINFQRVIDLLRAYLMNMPIEGGRYDSWRERLDHALADLRAELSNDEGDA